MVVAMAVTLKDIASRVGRSVTTVSRARAGYDDVSPVTREEVRRVAAEIHGERGGGSGQACRAGGGGRGREMRRAPCPRRAVGWPGRGAITER